MNRVTVIGRVGQDPKIHVFESGNKVAKFSLATSEKYKKDNETIEDTSWHNIVIYGRIADVVDKYVSKGDLLALEGKIKYREYEDKEKVRKFITELVCSSMEMLTPKKEEKPQPAISDSDPNPFDEIPGDNVPLPGIDDMPL